MHQSYENTGAHRQRGPHRSRVLQTEPLNPGTPAPMGLSSLQRCPVPAALFQFGLLQVPTAAN